MWKPEEPAGRTGKNAGAEWEVRGDMACKMRISRSPLQGREGGTFSGVAWDMREGTLWEQKDGGSGETEKGV